MFFHFVSALVDLVVEVALVVEAALVVEVALVESLVLVVEVALVGVALVGVAHVHLFVLAVGLVGSAVVAGTASVLAVDSAVVVII